MQELFLMGSFKTFIVAVWLLSIKRGCFVWCPRSVVQVRNVLYSWGRQMCKVLKWFSSIDCWLDGWAGILRHLTMLMVFRTNIYSPESRIWSGWSNATHSSQLFMNCDPSAIHHSWVLHHLIIQNNQQHICKLGLALSWLCFSCHKITAINKCWTPSAHVLAKENTALIALFFLSSWSSLLRVPRRGSQSGEMVLGN